MAKKKKNGGIFRVTFFRDELSAEQMQLNFKRGRLRGAKFWEETYLFIDFGLPFCHFLGF